MLFCYKYYIRKTYLNPFLPVGFPQKVELTIIIPWCFLAAIFGTNAGARVASCSMYCTFIGFFSTILKFLLNSTVNMHVCNSVHCT